MNKLAIKTTSIFAAMAAMIILAFAAVMTVSAQSDDPDWKLAPTGLDVAAGDEAGELDLMWDPHPQTTKALSDYRVTWTPDGEDFKTNDQTDWYAYPTTNQVTVTGLDAGETYKVKVRARYEDNKKSRWSQVQNGEAASAAAEPADSEQADSEPDPTPAPPPQNDKEDKEETVTPRDSHLAAPTGLHVTNRTVDAITLEWNTPNDSTVTHTYIHYTVLGTPREHSYPDVRTTFTAPNLPQNTVVHFTVRWATGPNASDRGAPRVQSSRTLQDKQVQNLAVSETTAESVILTWDNPTNYRVTGYEVQRRTGDDGTFATLEDASTRGTRFTDATVSANTTYNYRVAIKYIPSGSSLAVLGNSVIIAATTPDYSDVPAPSNFRITNATLTNGVYMLANHDDHPALDWDKPTGATGYKFTRKWIDSDATCGTNCPWLVVALAKGTGHSYFTDRYIAPAKYTFRIRGLDTTNNPGQAAEITVKLPDGPPFVPEAPTNFSVTGGRYGSAATLEGEWHRNDSPRHKIPPAFVVQWKSGNQAYPTAPTGNRSLINAWSGPNMLGADGNDQWSPAWNKLHLRHNFAENGFTPSLELDTEYTLRVGMCLTTACTLDDAVFAAERSVRTPAAP